MFTFVAQSYVNKRALAMYDSFLGFINEQYLVQPSDRTLLAVSGGLDSVVMVDLFARAGFSFGIAHVNFGLRGSDSDADEAFVIALADRLGVPVHTIQFDTATIAGQRGLSIQVAARELRYTWFETIANEHGYTRIATAHHQNDVLETMLLNLARGTGLAGLRGIPIRQGRIIRPLWFTSRAEIADYSRQRELRWREDVSNESDKYARNRLRHQVVPVLESLNPNLLTTLSSTVERLRATEIILSETLAQSLADCTKAQFPFLVIDRAKLITLTEWPFQLNEWIKPYGFSYSQSGDIESAVASGSIGQVFRSATHGLWNDRAGLIIAPLTLEEPFDLELPVEQEGTVTLPDGRRIGFRTYGRSADFTPSADPAIAYLDADQLNGGLRIRRWQPGDRFQPLNMRGTKLVSDLLNDRKVSLPERARTAVLTAGDQVVWVVGHRLAHSVRITERTRRVLECRIDGEYYLSSPG